MTDEDMTDEPSSEVPESSQEDAKPADGSSSSEETEYVNEDLKSPSWIFHLLNTIYNDRYYWDILKSTVVFILALKVARECNKMRIPIREYKPFNRS